MSRKRVLVSLLTLALLVLSVLPALAQDPFPEIFVDESRADGNEDGTEQNPYNTEIEGVALARSLPSGARLHITRKDGSKVQMDVRPCFPGQEGTPFPQALIGVALALLAVVLFFAGWQLRKRAAKLTG